MLKKIELYPMNIKMKDKKKVLKIATGYKAVESKIK